MVLRNNGGGNPYHDEKGRFTSGSGSSGKGASQEKQNMYDMKHSPNILNTYWKFVKPYMPPESMNDDQLIDKSLNNLIDYAKKIGISNPTPNSEWYDDLYYQLGNDGVPEEKIKGLMDKFESRMKEKEDDQLIDKSLNNLIDYAKRIGISNPVPNSDWTDDLYYQLSTDGVPEDKIRGLLDRFNSRMNNKKIQDMGFSPYNKK